MSAGRLCDGFGILLHKLNRQRGCIPSNQLDMTEERIGVLLTEQ